MQIASRMHFARLGDAQASPLTGDVNVPDVFATTTPAPQLVSVGGQLVAVPSPYASYAPPPVPALIDSPSPSASWPMPAPGRKRKRRGLGDPDPSSVMSNIAADPALYAAYYPQGTAADQAATAAAATIAAQSAAVAQAQAAAAAAIAAQQTPVAAPARMTATATMPATAQQQLPPLYATGPVPAGQDPYAAQPGGLVPDVGGSAGGGMLIAPGATVSGYPSSSKLPSWALPAAAGLALVLILRR